MAIRYNSSMTRPLIGITVDNVDSTIASGKYESNVAYSRGVAQAGGIPLLLPQEVELASYFVDLCDGIMLTGGNDARTELFGIPPHSQSRCIELQRQAFEVALLDALANKPQRPVLGVCLGMQLMALHAGGRLHQHLPDLLESAEQHQDNHLHPVVVGVADSTLPSVSGVCSVPTVVSSHHQGVEFAGGLRVIATSPDGVIEAIDDPSRSYYLGVQWHPERSEGLFNLELIKQFVDACTS